MVAGRAAHSIAVRGSTTVPRRGLPDGCPSNQQWVVLGDGEEFKEHAFKPGANADYARITNKTLTRDFVVVGANMFDTSVVTRQLVLRGGAFELKQVAQEGRYVVIQAMRPGSGPLTLPDLLALVRMLDMAWLQPNLQEAREAVRAAELWGLLFEISCTMVRPPLSWPTPSEGLQPFCRTPAVVRAGPQWPGRVRDR